MENGGQRNDELARRLETSLKMLCIQLYDSNFMIRQNISYNISVKHQFPFLMKRFCVVSYELVSSCKTVPQSVIRKKQLYP
jgi:hypothetical protein